MLYKTALYSVTQEYTAVKIGIDTVVASNMSQQTLNHSNVDAFQLPLFQLKCR